MGQEKDSSEHAEGTGQDHCKAALSHLWQVMLTGGGKSYTHLQKGKAGQPRDNSLSPVISVPGKITEQVLMETISSL